MASIGYETPGHGASVAGHAYLYDALMRPTQRQDSWDATTPATTRNFTYNSRSELMEDRMSQGGSFAYCYDNIGNRKTARELEEEVSYQANRLNQYMDINRGEQDFKPAYDADGNQTTTKTSTGIWEVSYDTNDRPVSFTSKDKRTVVECGYDYMGRRFEKKVTVNGNTSSHAYYLYRGYLQVAQLDLMHPEPMLEKSYLWDPTDSMGTRILMMTCRQDNTIGQKEHFYFMHDALKNVSSIFDGEKAERRARYEYIPFGGLITAQGDMAQENRFRFSCEYSDDELGLIYYNYRHLNPMDGRWINRDPIAEQAGWNLFAFVKNKSTKIIDMLGLLAENPSVSIEINKENFCQKFQKKIGNLKNILLKEYTSDLGKRCYVSLYCDSSIKANIGGSTHDKGEHRSWLPWWSKYREVATKMPCCVQNSYKKGCAQYGTSINFRHEAQHAMDFCDKLYDKADDLHDFIETEIRAYSRANLVHGLKDPTRKKVLKSLVRESIKEIASQMGEIFDESKYKEHFDKEYKK